MTEHTLHLSRDHLERHPVWAEDDACEGWDSVDVGNVLPTDLGKLAIRARFTTPGGATFDGFVVIVATLYCVKIFAGDQVFGFNHRLPELAAEEIRRMSHHTGSVAHALFPLRFETDYGYAGYEPIRGVYDVSTRDGDGSRA